MITMDITLVIQMVNIVILMFVLNGIIYKPVRRVLRERAERLQSMQDDIATLEENARRRQEEVDAKMAKASGKAKAALDSARSSASAAGDEKLAAIKAEADEMKEKQLTEVRTEIGSAEKALQGNLDDFATAMAGKILGRSL
ncbi:MAG: ATP synthase F0 subunit B [Thermodesulfobacteriota bacterium]